MNLLFIWLSVYIEVIRNTPRRIKIINKLDHKIQNIKKLKNSMVHNIRSGQSQQSRVVNKHHMWSKFVSKQNSLTVSRVVFLRLNPRLEKFFLHFELILHNIKVVKMT